MIFARDSEREWQNEIVQKIDHWRTANSSLLLGEGWKRAGEFPQTTSECRDPLFCFQRGVESLLDLVSHAGRCVALLQASPEYAPCMGCSTLCNFEN